MNINLLSLFPPIIVIIFFVNGSYILIRDTFFSLVPYTVISVTFLVLVVYLYRVPAPDAKSALEVLGKDPCLDRDDSHSAVKVIAHRGAGWDAPENSLPAFKLCSDKGCDFVEFDVTLTSDNVPVVFHDRTLERMSGENLVIQDTTWEELSKIDISVKHKLHDNFAGTRIPTLDETVYHMLSYGQKMIVDIKDNNVKMVPVVLNLFKRYPELKSKCLVSSFYPHLIYMIRRGNKNIVCSLAWKSDEFSYDISYHENCRGERRADTWYMHCFLRLCDELHSWTLPRITYYFLGISALLVHKDCLSGEEIVNWRNRGIRVMTWTVNDPLEKQFVERYLKITYLTDTLEYTPSNLHDD